MIKYLLINKPQYFDKLDDQTKLYFIGNNWQQLSDFVKLYELLFRATTKCSGAHNTQ